MQRESRVRVEQQIEGEVKTILEHETERLRRKLTTFIKDPLSIQKHVAAKDPIVLLADIFGIFEKYLSGYQDAKIAGFLQLLMKQQWLRQMFLLAIYEGAYGAERLIDEMREENRDIPHAGRRQEEILHKTHGGWGIREGEGKEVGGREGGEGEKEEAGRRMSVRRRVSEVEDMGEEKKEEDEEDKEEEEKEEEEKEEDLE